MHFWYSQILRMTSIYLEAIFLWADSSALYILDGLWRGNVLRRFLRTKSSSITEWVHPLSRRTLMFKCWPVSEVIFPLEDNSLGRRSTCCWRTMHVSSGVSSNGILLHPYLLHPTKVLRRWLLWGMESMLTLPLPENPSLWIQVLPVPPSPQAVGSFPSSGIVCRASSLCCSPWQSAQTCCN